MFTNEGFERGRAEAMETRERIERRDRIEAESADAQRSRLERQARIALGVTSPGS